MKQVSALIVDDEPLARTNIRRALSLFGNWQLVGEAENGTLALKACVEKQPDVIFLDVEMPGLSGLGVVTALAERGLRPHVVFVTAHSNFAVTAFELYAVDYLLKPFDDLRFAETIRRCERVLADSIMRGISALALSQYFSRPRTLQKIVVKSVGSLKVVDVDSLIWVRANGNYVDLVTPEGTTLHRCPISALEEQLDPATFVRSHRGALVRISAIREIRSTDDRPAILLSNGDRAPLSTAFKDQVLRALGPGFE